MKSIPKRTTDTRLEKYPSNEKQTVSTDDKVVDVPIHCKPYLTLEEAAALTNIGIHKLRELSNEKGCDFVLYVGVKRLFKRERMIEYLDSCYSI